MSRSNSPAKPVLVKRTCGKCGRLRLCRKFSKAAWRCKNCPILQPKTRCKRGDIRPDPPPPVNGKAPLTPFILRKSDLDMRDDLFIGAYATRAEAEALARSMNTDSLRTFGKWTNKAPLFYVEDNRDVCSATHV